MGITLVVTHEPTQEDRLAIHENLIAFDESIAGPSGFERIAVLIKDDNPQGRHQWPDASPGGLRRGKSVQAESDRPVAA